MQSEDEHTHYAHTAEGSQPRFFMCPPQHFAVSYSINPWMDPRAWAVSSATLEMEADRQWVGLRHPLPAAGPPIEPLHPPPGLPALFFTANAAVVLDRKVVLSRFRHSERRDEEPIFAAAFAKLAERGL